MKFALPELKSSYLYFCQFNADTHHSKTFDAMMQALKLLLSSKQKQLQWPHCRYLIIRCTLKSTLARCKYFREGGDRLRNLSLGLFHQSSSLSVHMVTKFCFKWRLRYNHMRDVHRKVENKSKFMFEKTCDNPRHADWCDQQ